MPVIDRSLISDFEMFEGFSDSELDQILEVATAKRVAKGQAIFEQHASVEAFFFLLDGHVRVVRATPEGENTIVRYLPPGEIFGIAPALGRDTYPASAVAAIDCVTLCWPVTQWATFVKDFPLVAERTYKTIGKRLEETQAHNVELVTEQVARRVARALLRLANQSGHKTAQGILIDFPISRQDVAEMTGTTLHTVSRLFSKWSAQDIVSVGRKKITILAAHQLVLLADGQTLPDVPEAAK